MIHDGAGSDHATGPNRHTGKNSHPRTHPCTTLNDDGTGNDRTASLCRARDLVVSGDDHHMVTDRHPILNPDLGAEINATVRPNLDAAADPEPPARRAQAVELDRAEDQGPPAYLSAGKAEKHGAHLAAHVRRKQTSKQKRHPQAQVYGLPLLAQHAEKATHPKLALPTRVIAVVPGHCSRQSGPGQHHSGIPESHGRRGQMQSEANRCAEPVMICSAAQPAAGGAATAASSTP